MLTFLFALAAIWTLFWLIMLLLDWGDRTPFTDAKMLCATCAGAIKTNSNKAGSSAGNSTASKTVAGAAATQSTSPAAAKRSAVGGSVSAAEEQAEARVKAAREQAKAEAAKQANESARKNAVKTPVADKHDQANVKPIFVAPKEKDDLKVIKGIGVVMERTLNDLGITTFKQLAGFKQAEVKMVIDALDESNSGFGDRINRDEWVDQAKVLVNKAS